MNGMNTEKMERKSASDYPQELLDLFHEYQHGDINRRTFLDRAGKFAVGGLTVAAIFESLSPNYAWAQQVPADDKRIKVSREVVDSPAGNGSIKGYLARPSKSGKLPVVLVIHENRGLNPYIEDVARRLAVANFIAFAPDGLTSVGGYPGDDEKGAAAFRTVAGAPLISGFSGQSRYASTGRACAVFGDVSELGLFRGRLLPWLFERKFTLTDPAAQTVGEGGCRVFTIGGDKFSERGEQTGLRQAIAVNAVEPRLGPGFPEVTKCQALLFAIGNQLACVNRTFGRCHCFPRPRRPRTDTHFKLQFER